MDVLEDILTSLRLTGGVVVDGEFSGDFCVNAEFTPGHFEPFFPVPESVISYHYVRSGTLLVELKGMPPVALGPGDIAILPRNDPHRLESRTGLPPAEASAISKVTADGVHRVMTGTGGPKAEVWCGFLTTAKSSEHPLLGALPPLLTLSVSGGEAEWLESSMRFLAEQQPSSDVVARLAELFVAQAVREYIEQLPKGEGGWLAGLRDPAVAKALAVIHSRFAEDIDIVMLAREAGVSRTVLGERFAQLLGEPPMRYCARWRMRVAANMLRDRKQNTANIAYAVGFNSEAAFNRAFKREYGEPPATWRRRVEAEAAALQSKAASALPEQVVRYCSAPDGARLAFSVVGDGPPLVKTANWLNHIEHDWKSPLWRHWLAELVRGRCLVRYDERANGLSDWNPPEISFDAFVADLESVVDCASLDRFDLLGISQGAAVAIAYAVKHPERVRRMVLCGGYAQGWAARGSEEEIKRREAMLSLTEIGWGADNPAYRHLFTNLYIPDASEAQASWFDEVQRLSASPANAVALQRELSRIDVTDLLDRVRVPTLVFHARGDQVVPFEQGEILATRIAGATFAPLESGNHILLEHEPAWAAFTRVTRQFLKADPDGAPLRPAAMPREPAVSAPKQESCLALDGTQLAYAVSGSGPPLVKAANWFNHLEKDWASPLWRDWFEALSDGHSFLRYDGRGHGCSGRSPARISADAFAEDLASVVDAAGLERFDLLGIGHGATVAIEYAAQHPERVGRLVLLGGWMRGWRRRNDPQDIARREAIVELSGIGWELDNPLYRELYSKLYTPGANEEQLAFLNEVQRAAASAVHAVAFQQAMGDMDLTEIAPRVTAPALLFHAHGDRAVPFSSGEELAAALPNSRLVPLEGENHILLPQEPAWDLFKRIAGRFLSDGAPDLPPMAEPGRERGLDRISRCRAPDGTEIAYAISGEGFPLVKAPNWITHLKHDRSNPSYRHWIAECSRGHQFLRSDMRGFGMSELEPEEFTLDAMVGDLGATVDDAGFEQCDLLGVAHGAPIAIAYAARHPERVRKLVLVNSFAAGWRVRANAEEIAWRNSLMEMNQREWSFRRSQLGEMFLTLYFPNADQELIAWHNEHFTELGPVDRLLEMIELAADIDVRADLAKVRAPALICHSKQDGNAPLEAGRAVADAIAGSRFVELESANHILLGNEPAWPVFVREMRGFLGVGGEGTSRD